MKAGEIISIPSPIDVHVHLREPGGEDQETISSGTSAALSGGYQAVFDMPNNPDGHQTHTEAKLDEKIDIAQRDSKTRIGFYAGVDLENPNFDEFPMMAVKAAGLKLYMGHTTGNAKEYDLETALPAINGWMNIAKILGIPQPPILLHARDEIGAETAEYIAKQDRRVHWCHISSETEVRAARELTKKYPHVYTGGVTPHHLTMTERNAKFQQGWNGARMQPPLGKEVDAEALLDAYNKSDIQILETDHAPHTREAKLKAEAENPKGHTDPDCTTCFGVSGIEFVLPVMFSLVEREEITLERLVDSLYDQPIKMLGMYKTGSPRAQTELHVGPRVIGEDDIAGKSRNNPYLGWTGWATVVRTTMAGVPLDEYLNKTEGASKIIRGGSVII